MFLQQRLEERGQMNIQVTVLNAANWNCWKPSWSALEFVALLLKWHVLLSGVCHWTRTGREYIHFINNDEKLVRNKNGCLALHCPGSKSALKRNRKGNVQFSAKQMYLCVHAHRLETEGTLSKPKFHQINQNPPLLGVQFLFYMAWLWKVNKTWRFLCLKSSIYALIC